VEEEWREIENIDSDLYRQCFAVIVVYVGYPSDAQCYVDKLS
jgi:hypothetical protein